MRSEEEKKGIRKSYYNARFKVERYLNNISNTFAGSKSAGNGSCIHKRIITQAEWRLREINILGQARKIFLACWILCLELTNKAGLKRASA